MRTSLGLLFFCFSLTTSAQSFDLATKQVRTLVKAHMEATQTPGTQVAVMHNGELVLNEAFGVIDEKQTPATTSTLFRVASVSKPLTAMAVMKLIEDNMIDPKADIRTYVEAFPDKGSPITAKHLMSSTSGIRHYTDADPAFNVENFISPEDALVRFADEALLFIPGSDYHYSSYGWTLLSAAIEANASSDFEAIMEDCWTSIGLEHTCFDSENNRISKQVTQAFTAPQKGERKVFEVENRSYMYAGGGYLSTAADLCRFAHVMLSDTYLTSESRSQMWRQTVLSDGNEVPYGLGWEVGQSRLGTKVVYHGGNMPSTRSHLVIYPELNLSVAWLANTGQNIFFNEREAHILAECFAAELIEEQPQPSAAEGTWKLKVTSIRGKTQKGQLRLQKSENGVLQGSITFKRYRKKEEHPIFALQETEGLLHLVAVTPMFDDFYLNLNDSELEGYWLHEFNVDGTTPDENWGPYPVAGKKE